jgi:hypothetical protein
VRKIQTANYTATMPYGPTMWANPVKTWASGGMRPDTRKPMALITAGTEVLCMSDASSNFCKFGEKGVRLPRLPVEYSRLWRAYTPSDALPIPYDMPPARIDSKEFETFLSRLETEGVLQKSRALMCSLGHCFANNPLSLITLRAVELLASDWLVSDKQNRPPTLL